MSQLDQAPTEVKAGCCDALAAALEQLPQLKQDTRKGSVTAAAFEQRIVAHAILDAEKAAMSSADLNTLLQSLEVVGKKAKGCQEMHTKLTAHASKRNALITANDVLGRIVKYMEMVAQAEYVDVITLDAAQLLTLLKKLPVPPSLEVQQALRELLPALLPRVFLQAGSICQAVAAATVRTRA